VTVEGGVLDCLSKGTRVPYCLGGVARLRGNPFIEAALKGRTGEGRGVRLRFFSVEETSRPSNGGMPQGGF